jgi:hypothetical protein
MRCNVNSPVWIHWCLDSYERNQCNFVSGCLIHRNNIVPSWGEAREGKGGGARRWRGTGLADGAGVAWLTSEGGQGSSQAGDRLAAFATSRSGTSEGCAGGRWEGDGVTSDCARAGAASDLRTSRRGAGVGDGGAGLAIGRGSPRGLRLFPLRHVEALRGRTTKGQGKWRSICRQTRALPELGKKGNVVGVRDE